MLLLGIMNQAIYTANELNRNTAAVKSRVFIRKMFWRFIPLVSIIVNMAIPATVFSDDKPFSTTNFVNAGTTILATPLSTMPEGTTNTFPGLFASYEAALFQTKFSVLLTFDDDAGIGEELLLTHYESVKNEPKSVSGFISNDTRGDSVKVTYPHVYMLHVIRLPDGRLVPISWQYENAPLHPSTQSSYSELYGNGNAFGKFVSYGNDCNAKEKTMSAKIGELRDSFEFLYKESDLIVKAYPLATSVVDTAPPMLFKRSDAEIPVDVMRTGFVISGVYKGESDMKSFYLIHSQFREHNRKEEHGWPSFASFQIKPIEKRGLWGAPPRPNYLLFLKKSADGDYVPTSGQDMSAYSVYEIPASVYENPSEKTGSVFGVLEDVKDESENPEQSDWSIPKF